MNWSHYAANDCSCYGITFDNISASSRGRPLYLSGQFLVTAQNGCDLSSFKYIAIGSDSIEKALLDKFRVSILCQVVRDSMEKERFLL